MIVYKFGGASVSSASAIKNLVTIVEDCTGDVFIVVSAFGKTTNKLENLLSLWINRRGGVLEAFDDLNSYHYDILKGLFPSMKHPVYETCSRLLSSLRNRLDSPPEADYNFEYDQMVSYGELISTTIISEYLAFCNIRNYWADARQLIITDKTYREANVDYELTGLRLRDLLRGTANSVHITQGFIGGTVDGFTTTLGREGSDYTAAIIGNLLDAERVVVWKDVPGILTADPALFEDVEKLDHISYHEAIELSFYGAKVIHPKTIKPLQNKGIPLYVRSFTNTTEPGTVIDNYDQPGNKELSKPILITKKDQILISLMPRDYSFVVEDCLSRIFSLFFKYKIKVNLIQHSAVSFTVCFDNRGPFITKIIEDLRAEFRVLYNDGLELITIRHYNRDAIVKHSGNREIIVEQRSRSTVMFVVR